ncbi:MAG TPA: DUF3079 domain-containing protein [Hyphomonas sp.]|nr:DUF3079 domain-containing protein [Hyphomonas sp.]
MSDNCLPRGLLRPKHPERICWGCDKYCPAGDLRCGGHLRTPHPIELFGEDWCEDGPETGTQAAEDLGPPAPIRSEP